jgi:hypothetical protein
MHHTLPAPGSARHTASAAHQFKLGAAVAAYRPCQLPLALTAPSAATVHEHDDWFMDRTAGHIS